MKKPLLYIDTDMGVDDIIAICMVIASNKFNIRGISVVNGVTSVKKGAVNLSRILKFIGISVPIYQGVDQISQRSNVQFPLIDRKRASDLTLLSGIFLPQSVGKSYSLDQLISHISRENEKVTLLCLGPLSNLVFLLKNKNVRKNISGLTIMGGALNVSGNVLPKFIAEYNFRLDPVAAGIILKSGLPITLVPIDATKCVPVNINNADSKIKPLLQKLYKNISDVENLIPLTKIIKAIILNNRGDFNNFYDPLAVAILIKPELIIQSEKSPVMVSLKKKSLGRLLRSLNKTPITIVEKVNTEYFFKYLERIILTDQKEAK